MKLPHKIDRVKIGRAADMLLDVRKSSYMISQLPDFCKPNSKLEAYAVQDLVSEVVGEIGGWKVGRYSIGDNVFSAPIYTKTILRGDNVICERIGKNQIFEVEVGFQLKNIDSKVGAEDIIRFPEYYLDIVPAIEIIDCRYENVFDIEKYSYLADNNGAAFVVLGDPMSSFMTLKPKIEITVDGRERFKAQASDLFSLEIELVSALFNDLRQRGRYARSGDIVISGALAYYINPNSLTADFSALGAVGVSSSGQSSVK